MSSSSPPEIELLISSMNHQQAPDVLRACSSTAVRPALLVINQCTEISPPAPVEGPGLRMLSFAERGLSRSRNRALSAAIGDILVLGDQDLTYLPSAMATLQQAFAAHPNATAITFQFIDQDTRKPLKRYAANSFRHGLRSIASVSSVEIAVRRERLGARRFDPRFGLGAQYPSGEEAVFLADLLRAGHALYYWPAPLCMHPGVGSGHRRWDAQIAEAKGAAFKRIYGRLWPGVAAYFALTKYPEYRSSLGLTRWLYHSAKGGLSKQA